MVNKLTIDLFREIVSMVERHTDNSALNPPATEHDFLRYTEQTGVDLPDQLKEIYRLGNGESPSEPNSYSLFGQDMFFSLTEAAREYIMLAELDAEGAINEDYDPREYPSFPRNTIQPLQFHKDWIIFAGIGGSTLVLDLAPDENGSKGQIFMLDPEPRERIQLAPSMHSFLELLLELYSQGKAHHLFCENTVEPIESIVEKMLRPGKLNRKIAEIRNRFRI